MFRFYTAVSLVALLSACGSGTNPFDADETEVDSGDETTTDTSTDTSDSVLSVGTSLPTGSSGPTATDGILRFEARDGNGGGLVSSVSYDATGDTFYVDNLGFDGANVYQRGDTVDTLNGFRVFEADEVTPDSLTGAEIDQIRDYRAILGVSKNVVGDEARTSFAIVRSGGYVDYGFGGFIYERNGGVTLPTTGQAQFNGQYAGVRVFKALGRLEYTTGDMRMDIDFEDFNANDAVKGRVYNREVFDINGNSIGSLPNLGYVIQEGSPSITENGEISGNIVSNTGTATGTVEQFEYGTYYGIIAGDATDTNDRGEIVGVFVIESAHPTYETQVQETGGFVLYR